MPERERMPGEGEATTSGTQRASGAASAGPAWAPDNPAAPTAADARSPVPLYVRLIGVLLILLALLWVFCGVASTLVAFVVSGSQEASASDSRSLPVVGAPTYAITAGVGSVRLVSGDPGRVSYTLDKRVRALSQPAARRQLDRITIAARQTGNAFTLAEQSPGFSWQDALESRSTTLTIALPPRATVLITTSAGDLTVSDLTLTGDSQIDQTAGNVVMRAVTIARTLTIRSTAGNVDLDGSLGTGATLDVRLAAGNLTVTLPHDTAAHLDAQTSAGNLSALGWPGLQTSARSAAGDLSANPAGRVSLTVAAGNLTILSR
jgi:hypothetical protein